jgi:hypothetical protein
VKITIKQLQEDIERLKENLIEEGQTKLRYFSEARDLKQENGNLEHKLEAANTENKYMRDSHNKELLEIIRWMICEETTKYPFQSEKVDPLRKVLRDLDNN